MKRPRVIPVLLLKDRGLVKTTKFRNEVYLGDPINAVKIFSDKQADELLFLDISATNERRQPSIDLIARIASECFMPLGYGGAVGSVQDIRTILNLGVEKVAINTAAVENRNLIRAAADLFGSQSIAVSIDVKKDWMGRYKVHTHSGKKNTGLDPVQLAVEMEELGAGELLLNSIDRDGTMSGFDLDIIGSVARAVSIPVVACGGARNVNDFVLAVEQGGASAVAAGAMFVFQGPHRAVLISYPTNKELNTVFHGRGIIKEVK